MIKSESFDMNAEGDESETTVYLSEKRSDIEVTESDDELPSDSELPDPRSTYEEYVQLIAQYLVESNQ